jgi:iron uptake system EfeUOB component EfeO/EfeM
MTAACAALVGLCVSGRVNASSLDDGAERYRAVTIGSIGEALDGARALRDRVAAGDLAGARQAWIAARAGWERSEVFTAGFVPELDALIDAWPNATSGFHAIEARLFGAASTDVGADTDALVAHLDTLHLKLHDMPLPAQGLLAGTVRLAYEVGESKADGGESRISGTSLDDMRNNVAGVELAYRTIFADALRAADPARADLVAHQIARLQMVVAARDLPHVDVGVLREASEQLAVALQDSAGKLGLSRPTLEAQSQ